MLVRGSHRCCFGFWFLVVTFSLPATPLDILVVQIVPVYQGNTQENTPPPTSCPLSTTGRRGAHAKQCVSEKNLTRSAPPLGWRKSPRGFVPGGVSCYHPCVILSPCVLSYNPCVILLPVCHLVTSVLSYHPCAISSPVCYLITRVLFYHFITRVLYYHQCVILVAVCYRITRVLYGS